MFAIPLLSQSIGKHQKRHFDTLTLRHFDTIFAPQKKIEKSRKKVPEKFGNLRFFSYLCSVIIE